MMTFILERVGVSAWPDPSDDIEKALEAAIDALAPVATHDGSTTPPEVSMEAILKLAAAVDALEELEYQQLVAGHESG
jgi:N12 class adenine-specific DNA methylase